jgi:LMBR1-like membrane protein
MIVIIMMTIMLITFILILILLTLTHTHTRIFSQLTVVHESTTNTENNNTWCSMHTEGIVEVAPDQGIKSKLRRNISHCRQVISNFYHKICSAKNFKASCRFFSALCGVLSFTILWSELFMAAGWRSPVAFMMGAYSPQRNLNEVVIQAVSFLALSYMSICTYWSLFRLNLGWAFTLQGPQLSPPSSLIFNGEYFSRLQFALGYNFLMLLNLPG